MGNERGSLGGQWVQDPSGRHAFRYWDGSRWTAHVSDQPSAPVDAPIEPDDRDPAPAGERGAQPEPEVGEPAKSVDHRPEGLRRQRRSVGRRRRAFLLGALAGCGVTLAAAAAAVALLDVRINNTSQTTKHSTTSSTTSTTVAPPSSQATTTTVNPGRPPQQVRVEVINAAAVLNAARTKAFALGALLPDRRIGRRARAPRHRGAMQARFRSGSRDAGQERRPWNRR
jgi:hypothetical protein